MKRLAVEKVEAIKRPITRREYRRLLIQTLALFWFAACSAIGNAVITGFTHWWGSLLCTALPIALLMFEAFMLTDRLPRYKHVGDEWDAITATCAFCGERKTAGFESVILAWAAGDALTGQTANVPVCLECRDTAQAAVPR